MRLTSLPNGGLAIAREAGEFIPLAYSYRLFLIHQEREAERRLKEARFARTPALRAALEAAAADEIVRIARRKVEFDRIARRRA